MFDLLAIDTNDEGVGEDTLDVVTAYSNTLALALEISDGPVVDTCAALAVEVACSSGGSMAIRGVVYSQKERSPFRTA